MPASNAFNLARTSAIGGLFPGTSASGDPTFAKWVIDALDGNSGFDILTYGDSNIGFSDNVPNINGINDGLSRGLETLGIPLYATTLKVSASLTADLGLYFQDFISTKMYGTTGTDFIFTGGATVAVTTTNNNKTLLFGVAAQPCVPIIGMQVTGTLIPNNTYITAVTGTSPSYTVTLSNACTVGTVTNGGMSLSSWGSESRVTDFDLQVADFSGVISPVTVTVTATSAVNNTCIVPLTVSGGTIPATRYAYVSPDGGVTKIKILGKVDSTISGDLLVNGAPGSGTGLTGTYILSRNITLTNGQSLTVYKTDPGLHLSGSSWNGAFPLQVPSDEIYVIPASNSTVNKQLTIQDASLSTYWPAAVKGTVIGRFVLGTAPSGNTNVVNSIQISEVGGSSFNLPNPTSTVGPTGGYKVVEIVNPANPSRSTVTQHQLVYPGAGGVPLDVTGPVAVCMASLYSPIVGFAVQTINYKGGATTDSCLADLVALDAYNSMKKVQLLMKETVERQRAASVKNSGRVVIAIQAGTNFDAGGNPLGRGIAFIDNVAAIQRLLKKAWKLAGQPEAQLCFLVMFGPVVSTSGVVNGADSPITRNYIKANAGKLLNTLYIDHATNLPLSTYQTESLWDDENPGVSAGSAIATVHLDDTGYVRWGKVLAANTVLHLKRIFKTKK